MDDKRQIEIVLQTYIESMNKSDPEMVRAAFHENAKVTGYLHGDLAVSYTHLTLPTILRV